MQSRLFAFAKYLNSFPGSAWERNASEAPAHPCKYLCKVNSIENLREGEAREGEAREGEAREVEAREGEAREGEAPAEPTVQRFGRSLTLPSNE
ncbi:MAG: hypothetical protein NTY15_05345 [Planctomycetota bacterium]|nr:hypothetical protein [Planctomycetota bacterium]